MSWTPFQNSSVAEVFQSYPKQVREKLMVLRELIFQVAAETEGVGPLEETLKWGQPSYVPSKTKSGTTVRLDQLKKVPGEYAIYTHCQTPIIEMFREMHGDEFVYEKNRAIHFTADEDAPKEKLRQLITMALTYHLWDVQRKKLGKKS